MNQSSDAAEQIVRLSLEGIEVATKITGVGAKNLAVMLYAIMKDQKKTAGKTKLTNMLKSGKELKVFSVKQSEFNMFKEEAKKYGVLYCALGNKNSSDGIIDVLVKIEDAGKINRIVERFKLSQYNEVKIVNDIQKSKNQELNSKGDENTTKNGSSKSIQKDSNSLNPLLAKTEKSPLSKHSLKSKNILEQEGTKLVNKPSVRKALENYKKEVNANLGKSSKKSIQKQNIHDNFKSKNRKKKNIERR